MKKFPVFIAFFLLLLLVLFFFVQKIEDRKTLSKEHFLSDVHISPSLDWRDHVPALRGIFADFLEREYGGMVEIGFLGEADITGDTVPEALIELGSKQYAAVVTLKNNEPSILRLQKKDGSLISVFKVYTGGGGRYGSDVRLDPKKRALHIRRYSTYGRPDDFCFVEVYVYNVQTELFEFEDALSQQSTAAHCLPIEE